MSVACRSFTKTMSSFLVVFACVVFGVSAQVVIERPINPIDPITNRTSPYADLTSYPGESCNRECVKGVERICYYKFYLEYYHAMGSACGNCANGVEKDCYHPYCILGDGTEKGVMSINRQVPGPAIQVCKNDVLVIDVINHAHGSAAAIHWHGMHMRDTPWMDGVPFTTQCPILYGNTFRYQFKATEAGTQFYHSHSGHHKINGQYGALIVREPEGTNPNEYAYDFDHPEHHVLISDWMHNTGEQEFPGLPSRGGIKPDSVLINGKGVYTNPITLNRTNVPVTQYVVEQGKRYRFRVINAVSHACPFQIQIQNHRLEVIASDSFNVEPQKFDTLVTNSGERFDFVLHANQDPAAYWIRVRGLGVCGTVPMESYALLSYAPARADIDATRLRPNLPLFSQTYPEGLTLNHPRSNCFGNTDDLCISELVALDINDTLRYAPPDHKFFLAFTNNVVSRSKLFDPEGTLAHSAFSTLGKEQNLIGTINNITMVFPTYSPLTQPENINGTAFCDTEHRPANCQPGEICPCIHRLKIKLNSIVELVIVDETPVRGFMHHPFHLHGFRFLVTGLGQHPLGEPMTVQIAKKLEARRSLPRDYFNQGPPFKDTISIPSRGYAVLRFYADNPGFWLMHCHYEWHMAIGMALMVQVGEPKDMVKPPPGFPKCGNFLPAVKSIN